MEYQISVLVKSIFSSYFDCVIISIKCINHFSCYIIYQFAYISGQLHPLQDAGDNSIYHDGMSKTNYEISNGKRSIFVRMKNLSFTTGDITARARIIKAKMETCEERVRQMC